MALTCVFGDGFDSYIKANIGQYWTTTGTDTKINTTPGVPRTGLGCLEITSAAFGPSRVFTASDKVIAVTAFNPNGLLPSGTKANLLWLVDATTGSQQVRVCYEGDASISVYNGNDPFPVKLGQSAAGVLDTGGYNLIVCKALIGPVGVGSVQIRCNGVVVLTLTGVKTQVTASAASVDTVQLMAIGGSTATWHDDTHLWYWTADADDITGAPVIYEFVPVSDSAPIDWTPSVGVNHFACVDEVPPDTTDYVSSNTVGAVDQYIHGLFAGENVPPIPASFTVLACIHAMLAELDAPGAHDLASNANGSTSAASIALTTSYLYRIFARTPGPVTSLATLATTPFGPEITS